MSYINRFWLVMKKSITKNLTPLSFVLSLELKNDFSLYFLINSLHLIIPLKI